MMDIKIEYMIEAYNLKFEKICTYCETLQIVKPVIEKFAQKILTTILMSLSVVFSIVWVGNKATDKIVDELKRGRENLKDSAKETGDKIKQFSNDISNTAKDLKSKEGQIWLIDKIRIMV
ncbi:hypothetical protein M0R36_10460, partial [bacterium]|nr:hypothetical protein [bacterium]